MQTGSRGWIRTSDLELMRLVRTARLLYSANLAPREGIEPSIFGFGDRCAASCATEISACSRIWSACEDSNLGPLRPKRSALIWLSYMPIFWIRTYW